MFLYVSITVMAAMKYLKLCSVMTIYGVKMTEMLNDSVLIDVFFNSAGAG